MHMILWFHLKALYFLQTLSDELCVDSVPASVFWIDSNVSNYFQSLYFYPYIFNWIHSFSSLCVSKFCSVISQCLMNITSQINKNSFLSHNKWEILNLKKINWYYIFLSYLYKVCEPNLYVYKYLPFLFSPSCKLTLNIVSYLSFTPHQTPKCEKILVALKNAIILHFNYF